MMKSPFLLSRVFTPVVVAGFLATAAHTFSQTENTEKAAPRQQFAPTAAGRFAAGLERILGVLTEEQRASMRQTMEANRERIRDLEQRIRQVRRELFELGLREDFDEAAVREKANAVAKLEAEMTVLRVKAISQIRPPLTPEQIQKIKNLGASEMSERQGEGPRRRRDIPRDENGLPSKDQPQKNGTDQK